jgi:hypothetical protein
MNEDNTVVDPPNLKRLEKLAKHLQSGKLGHKKFDFSAFNGNPERNREYGYMDMVATPYTCGTNGCAIGECPILFKSLWKFDANGLPALRGKGPANLWPEYSAEIFFSLQHDECIHLFIPEEQATDRFGGCYLDEHATKKQVAKNIREFVALFKSNPWR